MSPTHNRSRGAASSSAEAPDHLATEVAGTSLAAGLARVDGAVAIVVGRTAAALLRGVRRCLGPLEAKAVTAQHQPDGIWFAWQSGPPPPDRPMYLFIDRIETDATAMELLERYPRSTPSIPVAVFAAEATPEAVTAIQARHPHIEVHVADPDLIRHIPSRSGRSRR